MQRGGEEGKGQKRARLPAVLIEVVVERKKAINFWQEGLLLHLPSYL